MEYTALKSFDDTTLAVGYGDKEGTATYMTYGVSPVPDNLLTYAEYSNKLTMTQVLILIQMAVGLKVLIQLKTGWLIMCVPFIFFWLITIMIVHSQFRVDWADIFPKNTFMEIWIFPNQNFQQLLE